jgi:hypothetical protein
MSIIREPLLRYAAIKELHPTQITVGMRKVEQKRKRWRRDGKKKRAELLGRHLVPVILGPQRPLLHRRSSSSCSSAP